MRVTENVRFLYSSRALQQGASRMLELSTQIASGQKITKPSHDPATYSAVVQRSDFMNRLASRRTVLERSSSDLRLAEGALASAGDLLVRARELAIQFADPLNGPSERTAAAKEVAALRQQLVALANTKGQRGYVFAGTQTQTPPIDSTGAFVGDALPLDVEYAEGQYTASNVDGAQAFSAAGGVDPFALLQQMEADLAAGNLAAIRGALPALEAAHAQVTLVRTDAGGAINRLESSTEFTTKALAHAQALQVKDKQSDLTELATQMNLAQTAYERSIAVTRQVLNVASLVDRL
jgi:flagellar hook-associated protein 3 FlgL